MQLDPIGWREAFERQKDRPFRYVNAGEIRIALDPSLGLDGSAPGPTNGTAGLVLRCEWIHQHASSLAEITIKLDDYGSTSGSIAHDVLIKTDSTRYQYRRCDERRMHFRPKSQEK